MRKIGLAIFAPVLLALAVRAAAAPDGAVQPIFRDRAAELGVDFRHFNGMSGELYYVEMMGPGGALFDYDNDGDLDLYLVQGNMLGGKPLDKALVDEPLRDRLYRNDLVVHPDGRRTLGFTDVTGETGLDATGYGMGAATGDYDNDGWTDLYVTNFGANQLWRNRGAGPDGRVTFEDVTGRTGTGDAKWSIAAVFFDHDRDGWLDLYVGNYVDFTVAGNKYCPAPTGGRDYCGPLAFDPEPDRLLRNRGDGTFEDVTVRTGLAPPANGMGAVTGDFDGNGWPDLYVSNDAMANQLWLNAGRGEDGRVKVVDDALLAGCAFNLDGQPEGSMGVAAGDVDGDGREDLLVTHLIHETNTLYLNRGEGAFLDATAKSGLGTPSWLSTAFGVAFLDYDNDGWLDVLVVNGAVRLFDQGGTLDQPNQLFHNLGNGRFEDVTARAGEAFRLSEVSRGLSYGDLDNDGDVDAVVHNNHGPVRVLINEVGQDNGWLGLRLAGAPGRPREALGAEVELVRGGRVVRRHLRTAGSYASASDPRIVFGLGAPAPAVAGAGGEALPIKIRVRWPSGEVEEWPDVPVRRYSTLRHGQGRGAGK